MVALVDPVADGVPCSSRRPRTRPAPSTRSSSTTLPPTCCPVPDAGAAAARATPSPGSACTACRARGRRPRPDRRLRQGAHPVRSPAGGVPGRGHADRRRLRRLPHGRRWPPTTPPGGSPRASTPPTTSPSRRTGSAHEAPAALHTCHHLHGGMGVDETYPLHHYFSWVTDITHALGGPRPDPGARSRSRHADAKNLELTAEQRRAQGRAARLLHRPRQPRRAPRHDGRPARRDVREDDQADGQRRLDGRRLAEGVRRPRARRGRADDLRQRGPARRRAPAGRDPADGRPDADQVRHGEAEGPVPQADPRGRRALRDRLQRARRRHRPGLAADDREARRRPLRRQRPEDVDHRRPPGRLRLAGGAHRPGRPQAQGHLDPDRRHVRPRLLLDADHHRRRLAPRERDVLQRRARAGRHAGRRGEPGLEADHHPAQPRAGDARPGRPARGPARPGRGVGRTSTACSTSPTYAGPWPR